MNYRFFPSIIRFEKQKLIIDIGHMTDGEFYYYYYYYYQKLKDMDLQIINTNILLKIRKKERENIINGESCGYINDASSFLMFNSIRFGFDMMDAC